MDARARLIEMRAVERLAACDASLFVDPSVAETRLGWIGLPEAALASAAEFASIAADAVASGVTGVVLLGMGGSSLAPLVLSRSIGSAAGYPALHVLDTVAPRQVASLLDALAPASTLVIVSSKSGGSIEPLSLFEVFHAWMSDALGDAAGAHFIAITDPGTPLEALAAARGFARVVHAPATVGGRYAALTPFATFPAALCGIDVARLATNAAALAEACAKPGDDNPAMALAGWMSDAYEAGRDKLTVVCSPALESFGLWVEQLVAESTGKRGAGVLPVLEGGGGNPGAHGPDRMTFVLRTSDDEALAALPGLLPEGEPVFEVVIDDVYALAAEFTHWVWAIALFSALQGIEPFDQPDVEASKAETRAIVDHTAAAPPRTDIGNGETLVAAAGIPVTGVADAVAELLERTKSHGYLAVLAYLPEDEAVLAPLRGACADLSAARRMPVTLELGPRYLHSTGQYHKGGPADGSYLVISVTDTVDLPVPGRSFTLAELHAAQPAGDVAALLALGRPVLAVELPDLAALADVVEGLGRAARS